MNDCIIDNINRDVSVKDDLYILGDFVFGNKQDVLEFLNRIHCKNVYFIKGNHDKFLMDKSHAELPFKWIKMYHELKYQHYYFILFHYPIMGWNRKHYGSIHLYGHVHKASMGREICEPYMKNAFNVGVEFNDYKPVSIETVISWYDPTANQIY